MSATNMDIPHSSSSASSSAASSPSSSPSPSASPVLSKASTSTPSNGHKRTHSRPSLLSSSVSKVQHEVFDLGVRDGSPRLITCVKSSQGFDWNMEMFLPSHCDLAPMSLTDRPDPVHEIIISEDEQKSFFPS
ncbi:hypothetical protein BJ508DRAFT_331537 [Ascobolus immersus RN42]|uniref:Uncharacterized protein n=1 Tax=Ascobolus immersus RN42 TaxID=1160509 RepID=A0A3N4HU67_ASCIM|nr:hypothetical protein BJ508DRAFT_331537 [Ascobolus immersus RN42]